MSFLSDERPDSRHGIAWLTRYRAPHRRDRGDDPPRRTSTTGHLGASARTRSRSPGTSRSATRCRSRRRSATTRRTKPDFYVQLPAARPDGSGDFSSDYRLSTYGALGLRPEGRVHVPHALGHRHRVDAAKLVVRALPVERRPRVRQAVGRGARAWSSFTVLSVGLSAAF